MKSLLLATAALAVGSVVALPAEKTILEKRQGGIGVIVNNAMNRTYLYSLKSKFF
jgi:hypothetical protein